MTAGAWGSSTPKRPKPGAGREALSRRAKARGGKERRASAQAARRALSRGPSGRRRRKIGDGKLTRPVRGAWNQFVRYSKSVQKRFLVTQRLRNLVLAIAGVWVAWTFLLGDASLIRLWSVRRANVRTDAQIRQLETREIELKEEVHALSTGNDPATIERLAREEHALVRDGEKLVRFYADDGKTKD